MQEDEFRKIMGLPILDRQRGTHSVKPDSRQKSEKLKAKTDYAN